MNHNNLLLPSLLKFTNWWAVIIECITGEKKNKKKKEEEQEQEQEEQEQEQEQEQEEQEQQEEEEEEDEEEEEEEEDEEEEETEEEEEKEEEYDGEKWRPDSLADKVIKFGLAIQSPFHFLASSGAIPVRGSRNPNSNPSKKAFLRVSYLIGTARGW